MAKARNAFIECLCYLSSGEKKMSCKQNRKSSNEIEERNCRTKEGKETYVINKRVMAESLVKRYDS